MNRRRSQFALLIILYAMTLMGCASKDGMVPGEPRPLSFSQVRLEGEFGTRFAAATSHLMTWTDLYSLSSFIASSAGAPGTLWPDWPGDLIGRWLSVAHVARGYGWKGEAWPPSVLADAIFPNQSKDGNFGPPASSAPGDVQLLSGNAFALRGMMDAYEDTKDARFLEGARRLGRLFEKIAPAWETKRNGLLHEFYGHCIDGLVALYEQAGDRWALETAERLAAHAGRTPHTHHSLSLMRGLVDLARASGKKKYLEPVEDYLAWCRKSRSVTGGLPEAMPYSEQDEGCGLADWVVVNLMMAQATGENRYLDDAEHTLVNHFFLNQFHTGGFGHLSFTQEIVGGKLWQGWKGRFGSENPGCCSLWGMWALGQAARYIALETENTVFLNLYPEARISLPDKGARIEIAGDFPSLKKIRLRVTTLKPRSFALALRVPAWAEDVLVTRDGKPEPKRKAGRRVLIDRKWEGQTDLDVEFESGFRLIPWPADKPAGVGVFDGPLCLGLSAENADPALAWAILLDGEGRPVLDGQGRPQAVDPSGKIRRPLEPVSAGWLFPDIKDPIKRRILFQTKRAK